jgi:hypothetical protein
MSTIGSRTTTVLLALALMLSVAVIPAGVAVAQQSETAQGYTISVETEDELVASDTQLIGVEMDNTEGQSDLFSPIVEIPFPDGFAVSESALANAYVEYDNGSTAPVEDAEVLDSTFRTGDAIYLYGENIEQDDIHTYYVNVSIENPGSSTIEAETRLLYNENDEDVTARTQREVSVNGFGNVSVGVSDQDGTADASTDVTINGTSVGSGSVVSERVEGTYEISAEAPDSESVSLPSFTRTIGVGEDKSVDYTIPESLDTPTVIGTTRTASVADGTVGLATVRQPTAEAVKRVEHSYLLQTSGGEAVVAATAPDIGPVDGRTVSVDAGSATVSAAGDGFNTRLTAADDTTVTITYDGYKLGDTDSDDSVTSDDAATVAQTVAASDTGTEYYDVDGDGEITSVDAMYIAQYDADNRNADYGDS